MTVPTGRATVLMAVCAAVALGLGVLTRPAPTTRSSTGTGDAALAALGREVVGPDPPALAVAAVTPDRTRTAVLGAAPDARFEIGSITKGLTGLLFADMIARGEVAPTATVGALLAGRGAARRGHAGAAGDPPLGPAVCPVVRRWRWARPSPRLPWSALECRARHPARHVLQPGFAVLGCRTPPARHPHAGIALGAARPPPRADPR